MQKKIQNPGIGKIPVKLTKTTHKSLKSAHFTRLRRARGGGCHLGSHATQTVLDSVPKFSFCFDFVFNVSYSAEIELNRASIANDKVEDNKKI